MLPANYNRLERLLPGELPPKFVSPHFVLQLFRKPGMISYMRRYHCDITVHYWKHLPCNDKTSVTTVTVDFGTCRWICCHHGYSPTCKIIAGFPCDISPKLQLGRKAWVQGSLVPRCPVPNTWERGWVQDYFRIDLLFAVLVFAILYALSFYSAFLSVLLVS